MKFGLPQLVVLVVKIAHRKDAYRECKGSTMYRRITSHEVPTVMDELARSSIDQRLIVTHEGKEMALVTLEDLASLEEVDERLDRLDLEEHSPTDLSDSIALEDHLRQHAPAQHTD